MRQKPQPQHHEQEQAERFRPYDPPTLEHDDYRLSGSKSNSAGTGTPRTSNTVGAMCKTLTPSSGTLTF